MSRSVILSASGPRWSPALFPDCSASAADPSKFRVMYIFMNVPLMVATATSNFMIGVTAAASAMVYYRRGDILVQVAAPLAVGVFIGSLLGARLAPRIHTKIVVYLLVGVMLYLAGHLAFHLCEGVL